MPVGFFENRIGRAEGSPEGGHYQRTLADAVAMAREYGVDTALFTTQDTKPDQLVKLVDQASTTFRYVMVMPNLGGITNSAGMAGNFAGNFAVEIKQTLLFPWEIGRASCRERV